MKSKKKLIGIIIVLILIVVAGLGIYLYFFTDMFKSPQEAFYKYIEKMSKNELSYQGKLDKIKEIQNKSFKSNSTIGMELKTKGTDYLSKLNQVTYDEISKLRIEVETKNSPSQNKASSNISLRYNDEMLTELKLLKDSDVWGLQSEFVNEKYIALENKNLKSLARKLGQDSSNIPDQFDNVDWYNLLYVSEEEKDRIITNYKDVIKNGISADKFSKKDDVNQKINGEDKKTKTFSLKMKEKEFLDLIIKILEKLENDDETLDMFLEKINKVNAINFGINNTLNKKEDLNKAIKTVKEKIQNKKELLEGSKDVEFTLYISNEEVVRMEFKYDDEVKFAIDSYQIDNKKHLDFYTIQGNDDYHSYYMEEKNGELKKIIEIEYTNNKNEFAITFVDKIKVGFDIDEIDENRNSCKVLIETNSMALTLNIENNVSYDDDIQIEKLDNESAVILNNMKKEEIDKLFNEIKDTFQEKLMNKLRGIGVINPYTNIGINVLEK